MADHDIEVAVVGGGAAGIAAARRLHDAGVRCLIVEARPRLGGRAWTAADESGAGIDLGCGWLHSADRNPWVAVAQGQGRTVITSPPPWSKPSLTPNFPLADQRAFRQASEAFFARVDAAGERGPDVAAAALVEPGGRWNGLINAVMTYISGGDLDRVSAQDFSRYADTDTNWRVAEGYGAVIAAHGAGVPLALACPVRRIDHGGRRLKIETATGDIAADQAIVTLPTSLLADDGFFTPALPGKAAAARGLPLGLADKLFLALDRAEEFEPDTRAFGRIDRDGTGSYQFRPLGRPQIEAYFGGRLAVELERGGADAVFDFAVSELTGLLGSDFARRLTLLHLHCWGTDPFAGGSYSYALPGHADDRAALAAPVDDRLFFAGEACSRHDFSTAHGAYLTGIAAAEQVIAVRAA